MSLRRVCIVRASGVALALAVVLGTGGCRGSGVLAQGGWVFEGDDVIVTQADGVESRREAFGRVLRTIERLGLEVDRSQEEMGYVRTRPVRIDDTLNVRLNLVVADSGRVEIAGEYAEVHSREKEWHRVDWNEELPRGSGAWTFMSEVAQAVGAIQSYEEDPFTYEGSTCGGRRCDEDEVCYKNVCRAERQRGSDWGG